MLWIPTFFKILCLVFHWRKSVIQVWNAMKGLNDNIIFCSFWNFVILGLHLLSLYGQVMTSIEKIKSAWIVLIWIIICKFLCCMYVCMYVCFRYTTCALFREIRCARLKWTSHLCTVGEGCVRGCWSAARDVETLIPHPSLLCMASAGRQSRAFLAAAALTIDQPDEHLRKASCASTVHMVSVLVQACSSRHDILKPGPVYKMKKSVTTLLNIALIKAKRVPLFVCYVV